MPKFVKWIPKNDVIGGNHDKLKEVQPKLSPFQNKIPSDKGIIIGNYRRCFRASPGWFIL